MGTGVALDARHTCEQWTGRAASRVATDTERLVVSSDTGGNRMACLRCKILENGDEMIKLQIFLFSVNANFRMHNAGCIKKTEF